MSPLSLALNRIFSAPDYELSQYHASLYLQTLAIGNIFLRPGRARLSSPIHGSSHMNRRLGALLAGMIWLSSTAGQAETLTIAGRDGAFADALKFAVESYRAAHPDIEVERLELASGALLERRRLRFARN